MLMNFWWPIGFSADFPAKPKAWQVLNQHLVVYRTAHGRPATMQDICPVCHTPLSAGRVEGEALVCARGDAAFMPDGHSARGDGLFVDAYPAQDRYGWLFAFMGDLPEDERIPIPELPHVADEQFKKIYGTFEWNVHYARALENGVDGAHTPFVHGGAFGNPDEPEIEEYEVIHAPYSAQATMHFMPQPSKGLWRFIYKRKRERVKTLVQWWMPNMSLLEVHIPLGKLFIFNAHVPITDFKTVSHYIALRTFFKANWADADAHKRVIAIFSQDKKVVEAQRPELLPFDLGAELHVKSDAIQIAYRRQRQEFYERGWNIGGRSKPVGFVIPSPTRREMQAA